MKIGLLQIVLTLSLCFAEAQSFSSVIQKGHGEAVKSARLIRDGEFLITTSRDKTAKLWNASSGMEMRNFLGHESTVNESDVWQNLLATSSADKTIAVWDLTTSALLWRSEPSKRGTTNVAFSPDGKWLAAGNDGDSLFIYAVKDFSVLQKIKVNYSAEVSFSPDGKWLSIGEDDRTARLFSTKNWEQIYEFGPYNGYCGGCNTLTVFSPDNQSLVKLTRDSLARYDLSSGSRISLFSNEFDDIAAVDFHKNGDWYLGATEDSVFVFDASNDGIKYQWAIGEEIFDVKFHTEEELILIAADKMVTLTDLEGNIVKEYQGILNQTTTGLDYDLGSYWEHYIAKWVKYKPAQLLEKNSLFIGKTSAKARKWEVSSAAVQMEFIGHEKGILCFERINQNLIATGGGDGKIIIWEEKSGKIIKEIKGHREPVFDLSLSNDGSMLASSSWDGVISVWNTEDWSRHKYIYNEGASAYNIEFTTNDAYLVTGLLDKTLQLWELETKRFVKEFVGHTDVVTSIQVENNEIITTGWDGKVIIWDLYSGLIKMKIDLEKPGFAAIFKNEEIVTAGANRNITFWDRQKGTKLREWSGHQAEINGIQIVGDLLTSTDVDGVTKFWSLKRSKELFEHIQVGTNDWMVKTPEGYFDATDRAISNIHFVRGFEVFSSSQFMHEFYIPNLVQGLFSDTRTGKTSIEAEIGNSPPPNVSLAGVIGSDNKADLFLKVEDKGGGIESIRFFHNGKRVSFDNHLVKTRSVDSKTKVYSIKFPMVAGDNEFAAIALSNSNVASTRSVVNFFSTSKVPGSTCYILAIGINEYLNKSLNLNYAKPDAFSFAAQMKEQGETIYSNVELHQVYDRDATKEGILKKIEELKKRISVNDVFIFYYAGHGSMVDNKFYLVSSGANRLYDNQKMDEFGIEAGTLQKAMLEIKALKQLIIMDACQSGGSVEVLAQRGAPEEKAISQLSRSSGIHVMASAGSEQYATEFESLGHGLFTYLLLEGLSGKADGAPKDGKVTIYELKSFLDDQVPELSLKYKGTPQYPHTFSRGQDFPIVIVK